MSEHAYFAPSSAGITVHCPGSVLLGSMYPNEETEASRDGDASHWCFSEMFEGRFPQVGESAPNGVTLRSEHIEGACMFLEVVCEDIADDERWMIHIEERVYMPNLHLKNHGTPDVWVYNPYTLRIKVYDYKFGFSIVEVEDNWQVINYTIGCMNAVSGGAYNGIDDQRLHVENIIVQPRAAHPLGPVRRTSYYGSYIRSHANRLRSAFENADSDDPDFTSGKWCKNCPAILDCQTYREKQYVIMDTAQKMNILNLSPDEMGVELRYLEESHALITSKLKTLRQEVLSKIKTNTTVQGYTTGRGRSKLSWVENVDVDVIAEDLKGEGFDIVKPTSLLTPTQVKALRKSDGEKVDESVINKYTTTVDGGITLVEDKNSAAVSIFKRTKPQ